jgi:hypothetical protein
LFDDLLEIFLEIDLSEALIVELRRQRVPTPNGKRQRKPQTPSKIIKEAVLANGSKRLLFAHKESQTDIFGQARVVENS